MREDVALDFGDNLLKIEPPALDGKTPAILMHHIEEVSFSILLLGHYCTLLVQHNYITDKSGYFTGSDSVQTGWTLYLN